MTQPTPKLKLNPRLSEKERKYRVMVDRIAMLIIVIVFISMCIKLS